jgi:hypothetical protein
MKKLITTLGIIAALVATPLITAPAANAAPVAVSAPAKAHAPKKLHLQVVPVEGGYLVSWTRPKHAPKGLHYSISFQYAGSNYGVGYAAAVPKGASYFVFNTNLVQTQGAPSATLSGKWLVSVEASSTKAPFYAVGAKHFRVGTSNCGSPSAGGGVMHPMYCTVSQVG